MTDTQFCSLIQTLQQIAHPSFNGWQLLYSIVSGVIAVGAFWFISYLITQKNEKRHYNNLLIFLALEMFDNYLLLIESHLSGFIFTMWEKSCIDVARKMPLSHLARITGIYRAFNVLNGKNYSEISTQYQEEYKLLSVIAANEIYWLCNTPTISTDKTFDEIREKIKPYTTEYRLSNKP